LLPRGLAFGRHFLEMCIAMCAVGVPLTIGTLAVLGGAEARAAYPELTLLLIALTLTTPMTAWMLVRGMPTRPTLEMAAASFVVAFVLIGVSAVGSFRAVSEITVGEFCGLSCVAMFVMMLTRVDLYAGHHARHVQHAV
jgi:hypothetical protein